MAVHPLDPCHDGAGGDRLEGLREPGGVDSGRRHWNAVLPRESTAGEAVERDPEELARESGGEVEAV
jgi:hypothetical protein